MVVTVAVASGAVAQQYPARPIRLIVAWAPGGAPDIFARIVGEKLYAQMGQPVIVDNRPGATGNIGAEIVAKAPPDGHTIFNATLSLAVSPGFFKKLPFERLYRDVRAGGFHPPNRWDSLEFIGKAELGIPGNQSPRFV